MAMGSPNINDAYIHVFEIRYPEIAAFMRLVPMLSLSCVDDWDQPPRSDFRLTPDGYVIVAKAQFEQLAWYQHTHPSGVYSGKMWRREFKDGWHLCWYGVPNTTGKAGPYTVPVHTRPIILKEMAELLGMI